MPTESLCDSAGPSTCSDVIICYCKGPEKGAMIVCDNVDCSIEWCNLDCLKIESAPKEKWYCPNCRKLPQFTIKKKKQAVISLSINSSLTNICSKNTATQ